MSDCKPIELESGQVWKGKGRAARRIVRLQCPVVGNGVAVVYTAGSSPLEWGCSVWLFKNWIRIVGAVCVGVSDV